MVKRIGLLLLWLSVFISYGQTEGIEVGVYGGINSASLVGKGLKEWTADEKAKAAYGFDAGIRLKQPLGQKWGFRHELGFGMLTTKLALEDQVLYRSELRRAAIHVAPVNVYYQWGGLAVYGGPYLSFLTGASLQQLDEQGRKYRDKDIYGTAELAGDYMQKIDLGLTVGAEYALSKTLGLNVQFVRGFTPIMENTEQKNQLHIYNQFGSLTIHYKFSRANK